MQIGHGKQEVSKTQILMEETISQLAIYLLAYFIFILFVFLSTII